MTAGGCGSDGSYIPVVARVGADEAVGDNPGAIASGRPAAQAGFDFRTIVGDAVGAVNVASDCSQSVVDAFMGKKVTSAWGTGEGMEQGPVKWSAAFPFGFLADRFTYRAR